MKIKKGNSRIVFIGKVFVVKIPIIRLKKGIRHLIHVVRCGKLQKDLEFETNIMGTTKFFFFNGVVDNWQEYKFSRQNRNMQIIAKTNFSFFGLFNVQKAHEICSLSGEDIWNRFFDILPKYVEIKLMMKAGHHLTDARNFGMYNGKLKILDYGNKNLRKILDVCGHNIHEEFTL